MENVLLFGGTGFIGSLLAEALEEDGFKVYSPRIEVRDFSEVKKTIADVEPNIVINATGKTGRPNVDWCESNQPETFSVNVGGSLNIATATAEKGIYTVQLASGCIYDGTAEGGFTEEDKPNFFGSAYSRSRILSETALKEFSNVLQLRVRIPIMGRPHAKNLISKLVKYPKMINKLNSCTVMEDFIPATIELIKMRETGVFNMTNIGAMDHMGIMSLYKEIVDPNFKINLMSEDEQKKLCERRSNTVLSSEKREKLGIHMPQLEQSLKIILEQYKEHFDSETGIATQ